MGLLKKHVKQIVKKIMVACYHILLPVFPVKRDMIVFDSSIGLNYTGNPRAVYERMVEQGLDRRYRCIWFFEKGKEPPQEEWPGHAERVRYGRFRYLYFMSVAGIWVFDARQPAFIRKKPDQHYIQTWHGTPLKKLALDMDRVNMSGSKDISQYRKEFVDNTRLWDYLIAQNEFSAETFRRCFDFHKKLLCVGYPRNDVLFRYNCPEEIRRIRRELGLLQRWADGSPDTRKVLLYAPTWRDDEYDRTGIYEFRPKLDFDLLMKELKDSYIIMVKYHYLVGDRIDWSRFEGFVYPFTAQAEISSLYLAADALITDYSSVMFDYSLLGRPMFFYAYDLEKYRDELRGFYFDFLEEAPGPVSQTTEELIRDIRQEAGWVDEKGSGKVVAAGDGDMVSGSGEDAFGQRRREFSQKFHTYEAGTASDQVIRLIRQLAEPGGSDK